MLHDNVSKVRVYSLAYLQHLAEVVEELTNCLVLRYYDTPPRLSNRSENRRQPNRAYSVCA